MIDVSGDIIYFDNLPVGFIIIPNGTMRDRFEESLERASALNELDEQMRAMKSTLDEII